MDITEKLNIIENVLGDLYIIESTFDSMCDRYNITVIRAYSNWKIKMKFSTSEITMMGNNFVGAVCRAVVSEYSAYITEYND